MNNLRDVAEFEELSEPDFWEHSDIKKEQGLGHVHLWFKYSL